MDSENMLPVKCYNDLVRRLGCSACLHRERGLCKHPKLADHYNLRGNIFYYVENSCTPNDHEIRPAWCPTFSKGLALPSEKQLKAKED